MLAQPLIAIDLVSLSSLNLSSLTIVPVIPLHSDASCRYFCLRPQPWSTRSHIRRNRAPVHSDGDGFRPALVYLMIYCYPYLATVLYPFSLCFSLVLGSRASIRTSRRAPSQVHFHFHFVPLPLFPFSFQHQLLSCAPSFPGLFVCSLFRFEDFGRSHSLQVNRMYVCWLLVCLRT